MTIRLILLVEDDPAISFVVTTILQTAGYQVRTAPCVSDALQIFASAVIDCVITDRHLSGDADGDSLIADVQKMKPHLPAILISGDYSGTSAGTLNGKGITRLGKPFRARELLAAIHALDADASDHLQSSRKHSG